MKSYRPKTLSPVPKVENWSFPSLFRKNFFDGSIHGLLKGASLRACQPAYNYVSLGRMTNIEYIQNIKMIEYVNCVQYIWRKPLS